MTLTKVHSTLLDLAALAGVIAETLVHYRHVHPDDRGKPDLAAVSAHLAALRDQVEASA